jgi:hypothetical protein
MYQQPVRRCSKKRGLIELDSDSSILSGSGLGGGLSHGGARFTADSQLNNLTLI